MSNNDNLNVLEITLKGGLCNKLFCLFSACDIAIKKRVLLLEPKFGWNKPILFSDIYDIYFFNEKMKEYNNGKIIMIPFNDKDKYNVVKHDNKAQNLWNYSERILREQRKTKTMDKKCMNICVLNSLKLNTKNQKIADVYNLENSNGLHIRIESDWVKHCKAGNGGLIKRHQKQRETVLINLEQLTDLYKKKWSSNVFFTTGENQMHVKDHFQANDINSEFCFNSQLEYEINAAINFELCCKTKTFTGLTRSTFSNLISLKRYLLNKNNSFIYSYTDEIIERIDYGLQPLPYNAVSMKTKIV